MDVKRKFSISKVIRNQSGLYLNGMFEVMIGSSSRDIRLRDSFEVIGEKEEIISFKTFFTDVF